MLSNLGEGEVKEALNLIKFSSQLMYAFTELNPKMIKSRKRF